MKWLFKRLSEPSTWAGLGLLIPSAVSAIASGHLDPVQVGQIAAGAAAVLKGEGGNA